MPRGTSPLDEARLQNSLFIPAESGKSFFVGGGTSFWFDVQDPSTVTLVSGLVSQWKDKSFNSSHVAQTSATARPTFRPYGGPNGNPSILFDGVNDNLEKSSLPTIFVGFFSVFMVARFVSATGNDVAVGYGSDSAGRARGLYSNGSTYGFYTGGGGSVDSSFAIDAGGGFHIFSSMQGSNTIVQLHMDGVLAGPIAISTSLPTARTLRIGGLPGSSSFFSNVEICEVLGVMNTYTDSQRIIIEGYLAWKWGLVDNLPRDHLFKNRPPLIGDILVI
jgi:hypothetical protein